MMWRWLTFFLGAAALAALLSWLLAGYPALALVVMVAATLIALRSRADRACAAGFALGLALDMVSPEVPGLNAFAVAAASTLISLLSHYFHLENPVWYFFAGLFSFSLRFFILLLFHLVVDSTILLTAELRGFLSAALFSALACFAFYYVLELAIRR